MVISYLEYVSIWLAVVSANINGLFMWKIGALICRNILLIEVSAIVKQVSKQNFRKLYERTIYCFNYRLCPVFDVEFSQYSRYMIADSAF